MPGVLEEKKFEELKKYLPISFQVGFLNETESVARAYPLLSLICKNQSLLDEIRAALNVHKPVLLSEESQSIAKAIELTDRMLNQKPYLDSHTPLKYRLPHILGEFPIHTRVINHAINKFNAIVENYHQLKLDQLNQDELEHAFKDILAAIKLHGPSCDSDSLWQLLSMMSGWSTEPEKWFHDCPYLLYPSYKCEDNKEKKKELPAQKERIIPEIIESKQQATPASNHPFVRNYNYNIDRAGLLSKETYVLLLNAFGMKLGGHFDGQVKQVPKFIPIKQLHAIIHRQLSHRIEIPSSIDFDHWIEDTLMSLGMKQILQNKSDPFSAKFVNPFIEEPISFLNPEKIKQALKRNLSAFEELNPSSLELDIISQYLFDLLQSFQFNPGQALGIGANWDGTINLSNTNRDFPYKFDGDESEWGKLFKELSLHRQGPSEALMNVMKNGIKFELGTIFSSFDYMSKLQPSEWAEVIRSGFIDHLVKDLFPEPAYHENDKYEKHQKQHVVRRDSDGNMVIDSFYQPSKKGIYSGKDGNKKLTPKFRRAGTLDVQDFPRRSASSEGYRESYGDDPLLPFQMQYGQAMYKCTRGHIVYDPISADQFLPDPFYGQVLRSENGDYLPFIGVVPKNYDRIFKQPSELCASFVLRMINSSRLMIYCPTFKETYEKIKTSFLPDINANVPALPNLGFSEHIQKLHHKLNTVLADPARQYRESEKVFSALFKNLVNSLYESVSNAKDDNVKATFIQFITSFDVSSPTRANLERYIRELIVNKPVSASVEALRNYDVTIDYLKKLVEYFYPIPSDAMAKKIADQADAYVKPLLASPGIRDYFEKQKKIPEANLSRKSTPGSLFSAMQDGKIKHIWRHQKAMHKENMPSGYRDPEGNQLTAIQAHEKRLDKIVKTAGAVLQMMKEHDVLFGISKPVSESVTGAKQSYAKHKRHKYAWGIWGGIVGVVKGLTKFAVSIPSGIFASGKWVFKKATKKHKKRVNVENPLAISAGPGNEPGLKVKLNMQMRDYLLGLLNRPSVERHLEKDKMILRLIKIMSLLYPDMNHSGKKVTSSLINQSFPDFDWEKLLKPFSELLNDRHLIQHKAAINVPFTQAVFACLTDSLCATNVKEVVKKYYKFYSLSSSQKGALLEFVKHYNRIRNKDEKNAFLDLFQFNGKIHKSLNERDEIIQKIQTWNNSIYSMASTMRKMSSSTIALFREALTNNDLSMLDAYQIDNDTVNFLKSYAAAFQHLDVDQRCQLLAHCKMGKMIEKKVLSTKDIAHRQWSAFAQRGLRHELLRRNEVDQIFLSILPKLGKNPELIIKLKELKNIYYYHFLDLMSVQDVPLDLFYEKANSIIQDLIPTTQNKKEIEAFQQAKTLLQNFIDITMNAVVNSRLDRVDIFKNNTTEIHNPLQNSNAIGEWLNALQDTRHLRMLLDQQLEQSPSLDHALWRDKCILQVLEKRNPDQDKVHKTGLRSVLRVWAQHTDNVTNTGEAYFDAKTGQPRKVSSTSLLFDGSRTMQHAVNPDRKAFAFFRNVEYKEAPREEKFASFNMKS